MRVQAATQPQIIRVRYKKVAMITDDLKRQPWIQHWTALVKQMMPNLPDLDMAVNVMDERASRAHHTRPRNYRNTGKHMAKGKPMPMKEQYRYKYLPDIDSNSFSGRWRAFLKSTSMPLKATIYAEWHDDRMIPWVHFVPFDMSYKEVYAIMQYFLDGRDAQAEVIATESSNWANAVYRDEDMKLYVWRLLLEYACVVDDNRQRLASVDDSREPEQ
ncbi:hypothetical protein ACQRIT_007268 [Beauveria bassiana]